MGTANIILTAQPTTILQARHPRTIISNEGAITAYLDDQSAVTADVNDFVLRPGERIAWAENVPCWAVGNGATISTSINVERFSTPSPDDWLRYVNSIPPTFPPYVPPSEPVPVVSGGLVKITSGAWVADAAPFADGVFGATYDQYRIELKGISASVANYLRLRFRSSGVDDTGSYSIGYYGNLASGTGTENKAFVGWASSVADATCIIEVSHPMELVHTILQSQSAGYIWMQTTGAYCPANQHDGFSIFNDSSALITCEYIIYGYER